MKSQHLQKKTKNQKRNNHLNQALIALGSNLGNRQRFLDQACGLIEKSCGKILSRAKIYETSPIGNADKMFLNSALVCETRLSPDQLMKELLAIEHQLGRVRKGVASNRCIDLDIILMRNDKQENFLISESTLKIPHPRALERDFVILPACDVAAEWVHPFTQKPFSTSLGSPVHRH